MAVGGLTIRQGKVNRITTNRLHPLRQGTDTQTMKATHTKASEPDKTKWNFPCLAVGEGGTIVLFKSEGKGTRLIGISEKYRTGVYATDWDMDSFKPLPSTESVTLQND